MTKTRGRRETNGGGRCETEQQLPELPDSRHAGRQGERQAGRHQGGGAAVRDGQRGDELHTGEQCDNLPCSHIIILESQTIKLAKVMVTILTFVQPSSNQSQLII